MRFILQFPIQNQIHVSLTYCISVVRKLEKNSKKFLNVTYFFPNKYFQMKKKKLCFYNSTSLGSGSGILSIFNTCCICYWHFQKQQHNSGLKYQFSSVAQSCPTLYNPMDCSTPGFPVHHQFLGLAQIHAHQVGDAIQISCALSSPSPAFNLFQHQGLFQLVSSSHQVAKVLELQLQHQSFH